MDFVKLTTEQGIAAGKEIMADARCDAPVKAAIRAGLIKTRSGFTYTCNSATRKKNEWFDDVMIAHGVDNSAK